MFFHNLTSKLIKNHIRKKQREATDLLEWVDHVLFLPYSYFESIDRIEFNWRYDPYISNTIFTACEDMDKTLNLILKYGLNPKGKGLFYDIMDRFLVIYSYKSVSLIVHESLLKSILLKSMMIYINLNYTNNYESNG